MHPLLRRIGSVVWPAFLGAGALEMLVFAFVDPDRLRLPGGGELGLSPTALYSVTFFAFWVLMAGACTLTLVLERSATDLNAPVADAPPLSKSGR
jgi:cytosine/uracil/thiamine/allantoin permease